MGVFQQPANDTSGVLLGAILMTAIGGGCLIRERPLESAVRKKKEIQE